MAKELKLNLPPADDLFTTQEERDDARREKVVDLPISEIDDFPDHPYPVEMDEEMQSTVESVKAYGVHTPALQIPIAQHQTYSTQKTAAASAKPLTPPPAQPGFPA